MGGTGGAEEEVREERLRIRLHARVYISVEVLVDAFAPAYIRNGLVWLERRLNICRAMGLLITESAGSARLRICAR